MRQKVFLFGLVAVITMLTLVSAVEANPEGYQVVRRFIVTTENDAANKEISRRALEHGGFTVREFSTFSGLVIFIPERAVSKIKSFPGVTKLYADPVVTATAKPPWAGGGKEDPSTPGEQLPWGVERINADQVWDSDGDLVLDPGSITAAGVKIGIIDTGLDKAHPDLKANIAGGRNFVSQGGPRWAPKIDPDNWNDDNGHGSHVGGIVAAVDNEEGVIGTAPRASLYGVKVLDKNGSGYLSDVISGIEWSINNGMDVINLSLGTTTNAQELHAVIRAAQEAGLVLVAAAGNESGGAVNYPAAYPEVIAVSAVDLSEKVAAFSSTGSEVELSAPGVTIYSTYKGGIYETLSGTSMAAPHVTGAAALIIGGGVTDQNGDGLINDEVRTILQQTAKDLGNAGHDEFYGYGLVDAFNAVQFTAQ